MKVNLIWKDGKSTKVNIDYVDDIESLHALLEKKKFIRAIDEIGEDGLLNILDISVMIPIEDE